MAKSFDETSMKQMLELGASMRSDDGAHMTNQPLFVVFEWERIYTEDNAEGHEWRDEAWDLADAATTARLDGVDAEDGPADDRWKRYGYIQRRRFVTAFLTKAGATRFIAQQAHTLSEPHVYVHSLCRSRELQAVRTFLLGLPDPADGQCQGSADALSGERVS